MSSSTAVFAPTVESLIPSFGRSLRAENKAAKTVTSYLEAVRQLDAFLRTHGMPLEAPNVNREHIEAYISQVLENRKPATAANRCRSLQAFWKWCFEEGEIKASPTDNMKPPRVPEDPPPVMTEDELRRLLKAFEGTSFEDRRDMAIVQLFLDTGIRRAELASIKVEDIDWTLNIIRINPNPPKDGLGDSP